MRTFLSVTFNNTSMKQPLEFAEVVRQWIAAKQPYVKVSTLSIYSTHLQCHLVPAFGHRTELTEADIQALVNRELEEGLNPKTARDIVMILKMVLRFAAKNCGWESVSVEVHFPPEKAKPGLPTFSLREHKKMLNYLQKHPTYYNIGIALCLCTGMRIGEICALRWKDVELNAGFVRVSKTIQRIYVPSDRRTRLVVDAPKTANSFREIPLSRQLVLALRPIKRQARGTWYLLTNSPEPPEPRVFRTYFYRLCKDLRLPRIPFHGLRHTFATRCIESKCDYKTVSALLGHASIHTTLNFYVHPDLLHKKECVEQMTKMLK